MLHKCNSKHRVCFFKHFYKDWNAIDNALAINLLIFLNSNLALFVLRAYNFFHIYESLTHKITVKKGEI